MGGLGIPGAGDRPRVGEATVNPAMAAVAMAVVVSMAAVAMAAAMAAAEARENVIKPAPAF
jgi:hypothetical protein